MRQNEHQVAELTQQLAAMQREKERLESRARLLEQVVSLNLTHEARLHTNKVSGTTRCELVHDQRAYNLKRSEIFLASERGCSTLLLVPVSVP